MLTFSNCYTAHFVPAALSVVGPSTIHNGNQIDFKCTFSETLHTLDNCQVIYCCLKKNKIFLQMQIFNVAQMESSFTIESAVKRDSGNYSCLLLPTKCFQEHWNELQGMNEVFLEVKGGHFNCLFPNVFALPSLFFYFL